MNAWTVDIVDLGGDIDILRMNDSIVLPCRIQLKATFLHRTGSLPRNTVYSVI